jgi:hypothetical protein
MTGCISSALKLITPTWKLLFTIIIYNYYLHLEIIIYWLHLIGVDAYHAHL